MKPAKTDLPEELICAMDEVVREAGSDPDAHDGKLIREMLHTAVKLFKDDANVGELKLISRSLKELRYALKVFRPYEHVRKISVFGSARTPVDHPDYAAAVDFSQQMADAGWMVITGAGDGIMRAGHGGAGTEKSFGVSIRLPFETNANDYIEGDPKLIVFRYFFTRKLTFMWQSAAVALFPGGFGTQDEGFEALTLIQTGKAPIIPIVMVDAPGGDYWQHWENYVQHSLLNYGWISPEDRNLFYITDNPADAAAHVQRFYRNYHSQRFVRDELVLRIHQPLSEKQLAALNERFKPLLVTEGEITQQLEPLKQERDEHPELPRLRFHSTKAGYGHLRAMIDQINETATQS